MSIREKSYDPWRRIAGNRIRKSPILLSFSRSCLQTPMLCIATVRVGWSKKGINECHVLPLKSFVKLN
jgi:hypothetical protein